MPVDPLTPVIVGVAQSVGRDADLRSAPSPLDSLEWVAREAGHDGGVGDAFWRAVDWIAVIRTFADSGADYRLPGWNYSNLPRSLANRLGADPERIIYPAGGGNTPQWLVNMFADAIASGEAEVCLLAGAENTKTAGRAQRLGVSVNWSDDPGGPAAEELGVTPRGNTRTEARHGITLASTAYSMFESALGHHYGRTPLEHRKALGALMSRFSHVAAANPHSIGQPARSPDELSETTPDNRFIAYPYTKLLCANMFVDQAAAVLMMSSAAADRCGVPQSKRIYLRGSAETTEKWNMSDRVNFWSSPAIRVGARAALDQAGIAASDLDFIDLYSCFASPVEMAADALGVAHDDPRGLTVTGGLPYFGGPGSNYTTHAIAEMVGRLRARPGSTGLTYANGLFLTKHAIGIYSSDPGTDGYQRISPANYQPEVDALASPPFADQPQGVGEIEAFTVVFDRGEPKVAPLFGRLENGARFVANIDNPAMLDWMIDRPVIGSRINVQSGERINIAQFA